MQIKSHMNYHSLPIIMVKKKKEREKQNPLAIYDINCWQGMRTVKALRQCWCECKSIIIILEYNLALSYKVKHTLYNMAMPFQCHLSTRYESLHPHKHLY